MHTTETALPWREGELISSWIPSNDYKNKTTPSLDAIERSFVLVCVFGLLTWKYDMIMKAVFRTGLSRSFCLFFPVHEANSYQPKPTYCPYTTKPHETSLHKNMHAFSSLRINKIQRDKLIFALRGLTHRSRVFVALQSRFPHSNQLWWSYKNAYTFITTLPRSLQSTAENTTRWRAI